MCSFSLYSTMLRTTVLIPYLYRLRSLDGSILKINLNMPHFSFGLRVRIKSY